MGLGEEVQIDTTHAALQGCTRSILRFNAFTSACHTFSNDTSQAGVQVLTVHVFGARALGPPYPSLGDIGRKLGMCFQARACPTCCYGLQHCVTVEIVGHHPKILLPLAPLTAYSSGAAANFRSDEDVTEFVRSISANSYGKSLFVASRPTAMVPLESARSAESHAHESTRIQAHESTRIEA